MSDFIKDLDLTQLVGNNTQGSAAINILLSELKDFELTLTNDEELQIMVNNMSFNLYNIRARGDFVILGGVDSSNKACRLIFNIHQMQIYFRAAPKISKEARRIGFAG